MSIWKGKNIEIEVYGKSHDEKVGVVMKNFPKKPIDENFLSNFLLRRKPTYSPVFTGRKEADVPQFISGVENGIIVSDKVICEILNGDVKKNDYKNLYAKPRPSHADLAVYFKDGRLDFSGGGEFSGRLTAPICVAGGIAKQFLAESGITVFGYLSAVGNVKGVSYKDKKIKTFKREEGVPSLSNGKEMIEEIVRAKNNGDSVGGVVECVIDGFPHGVGGELFDGLEGKLAGLLYSVPGVKGVEFGDGFDFAKELGSVANDSIRISDGKIYTKTNRSGGINGGISNGMQITVATVFRPTPSISKTQSTVDLLKTENTTIKIEGRHDGCIAVRAVPVVEAVISLGLLDELVGVKL